jgi:hypothetical protein
MPLSPRKPSAYGGSPQAGSRWTERTPLALKGSNLGRGNAKACHETGGQSPSSQVGVGFVHEYHLLAWRRRGRGHAG